MIVLAYPSLTEAVESFAPDVIEFEKTIYWVTDRLGLVNDTEYELEWGNLIILLAFGAKLDLILSLSVEANLAQPPNEAVHKFERLRSAVAEYLNDFRNELERKLSEQFHRSVRARMHRAISHADTSSGFEDLKLILEDKDCIELFLAGASKCLPEMNFRDEVRRLDETFRAVLFRGPYARLTSEYSVDLLLELNVEWLPSEFWWRHIRWTQS